MYIFWGLFEIQCAIYQNFESRQFFYPTYFGAQIGGDWNITKICGVRKLECLRCLRGY